MVGVEVGQEDLLQLDQPDRADELALGALAAVEQQPVAAAPHERGGQAALGGGRRARGSEEEHVEVHDAPYLDSSSGTSSKLSAPSSTRAIAHRVPRSAAALRRAARVEDLEAAALLVQRQVRVAEHHGVGPLAVGAPEPLEPPGRGPPSCTIAIRAPAGLHDPLGGKQPAQLGAVDVAVDTEPAAARSPRARGASRRCVKSPGVEQQVRLRDPLDARVREPPRAARQVGVGDHGDQHGASRLAPSSAPVAQWIERSPPEARGRRFESCRARHP